MENLSDEELVRLALTQAKLIPYWMEDDTRNEDELISRLARGRKAMEAMEELSKELGIICVEVLQGKYEGIRDFANAYPITFDEGTPRVRYLTEDRTDYQQSCKEAADGN